MRAGVASSAHPASCTSYNQKLPWLEPFFCCVSFTGCLHYGALMRLAPFCTSSVGQRGEPSVPVTIYAINTRMCCISIGSASGWPAFAIRYTLDYWETQCRIQLPRNYRWGLGATKSAYCVTKGHRNVLHRFWQHDT